MKQNLFRADLNTLYYEDMEVFSNIDSNRCINAGYEYDKPGAAGSATGPH